jgi:hypothetical protein
MILEWMLIPEHPEHLVRESERCGYSLQGEYPSLKWKGDGVVLGRMFCPEPLLIREPE